MTQATNAFQPDFSEDQFTEDQYADHAEHEPIEIRDFSQNNVSLTFSWSLMNQLRSMARNEGIPVETLLIELAAEGVAKRVFEDQMRPSPSHLMTRNGYVHEDPQNPAQPQMSHHSNMNGNRTQGHGANNRNNKYSFQQRNNNYNNNRNYQGNNRSNQNNFRSNQNAYQNNNQQRFSRNGPQDENQNYPNANHKDTKR